MVSAPFPRTGLLLKRDATLSLGEPPLEGLQRGVEGSGDVRVTRAAEDLLEVALDLEHVAEILGARETEAAIRLEP